MVLLIMINHTTLLYRTTNTRNTNVLALLKLLVEKEQWGDFPVQLVVAST